MTKKTKITYCREQLDCLTYRDRSVIEFLTKEHKSKQEVAKIFDCGVFRIKQIEGRAIRRIINYHKRSKEKKIKFLLFCKIVNFSQSWQVEFNFDFENLWGETLIETFNFSVGTYNALKRARINSVQEILECEENKIGGLMCLNNLGNKRYKEVCAKVEESYLASLVENAIANQASYS